MFQRSFKLENFQIWARLKRIISNAGAKLVQFKIGRRWSMTIKTNFSFRFKCIFVYKTSWPRNFGNLCIKSRKQILLLNQCTASAINQSRCYCYIYHLWIEIIILKFYNYINQEKLYESLNKKFNLQ